VDHVVELVEQSRRRDQTKTPQITTPNVPLNRFGNANDTAISTSIG
jgi:hypothetical protein